MAKGFQLGLSHRVCAGRRREGANQYGLKAILALVHEAALSPCDVNIFA